MHMGKDDQLPNHLDGGPTIDSADFLLGSLTSNEVNDIHNDILRLTDEVRSSDKVDADRYLVLGNYDSPQMERLEQACELLEQYNPESVAFLLSDLSQDDEWGNFYLKFLYALQLVDFPILVAEDNDGGHELELGETPVDQIFVSKRSYEELSVDHDIEYEKYDAMIAKLFDLLRQKGRLFEWKSYPEFEVSIKNIAMETNSQGAAESQQTDVEQRSIEDLATKGEQDSSGQRPISSGDEHSTELAEGWEMKSDQQPEEAEESTIVQCERTSPTMVLKIRNDTDRILPNNGPKYSMDLGIRAKGRNANKLITKSDEFWELRAGLLKATHILNACIDVADDPFDAKSLFIPLFDSLY